MKEAQIEKNKEIKWLLLQKKCLVHTHSFKQVLKLLFALNPKMEKTEMEA